ncbi:MAG: hypothetical protein R6U45_11445 [Thioalkalivibrio sp.]
MRKPHKPREGAIGFAGFPLCRTALLLVAAGLLAACSDPGPAQEAGEAVDETVEEMDDDLRGWIEDLREDDVQDGESGPGGHDDAFPEEETARDMD